MGRSSRRALTCLCDRGINQCCDRRPPFLPATGSLADRFRTTKQARAPYVHLPLLPAPASAASVALEAYLAVAAADGTYPSALLALVAAAGQITGKLLWYWAGAGTTRLPWLRRKLESPRPPPR